MPRRVPTLPASYPDPVRALLVLAVAALSLSACDSNDPEGFGGTYQGSTTTPSGDVGLKLTLPTVESGSFRSREAEVMAFGRQFMAQAAGTYTPPTLSMNVVSVPASLGFNDNFTGTVSADGDRITLDIGVEGVVLVLER